jgi:ABC-type multidrug transport system ATPase subunit
VLDRRHIGYVQQQDAHIGTATVREALEFAAAMKLPSSVTRAQRCSIVQTAIDTLDLTSVADSMVGDADGRGITASERKRLTVGVELVCGPSVLVIDEPTTGLDSLRSLVCVYVCVWARALDTAGAVSLLTCASCVL